MKPKARRQSAAEKRLAMERVAVRLSKLLPEKHALIGGLAVGIHGYVRATKDVDFVVYADPKELKEQLASHGINAELRRGDILEGDIPWVLYGEWEGVRFDILPPTVPIDWERREWVALGDAEVKVVDVVSLIRLKLRAGGSLDFVDLAHLLRRHPGQQPGALELAASYGVRDRLEQFLRDKSLRTAEPD